MSKIRQILATYRNNNNYTIEEAEKDLLNLFSVSNNALIKGCKTVVDGYEGDGMENMQNRDKVFYELCKRALQYCY